MIKAKKKEGRFMISPGRKKFSFDYVWVIVSICFVMVALGLGFCSSGSSIYLTAITDALGISRGAYSVTNTIRYIATTVLNIYFGQLVLKFGTKKLICAGFVSLILFALISSVATNVFTFYVGGAFLGIGLSWTTTTMTSTIINRWCKTNKGTITGAILSANGLGGAVAIQIISPIIFEEGKPFGYRNSYRLVASILVVVLILVILLYREYPKDAENKDEAVQKKRKPRGTGWIGMEYEKAVKKPYFYIAIICIFFSGMALQGLSFVATPHMYDVGIDVDVVANIASMGAVLLTVTKFLTGFLYDRFGMKLTMNICLVCSFVSTISLFFVSATPLGQIIAYARQIFNAFALPLETVMLPLYASELFGNKSFDKLVGIFTAACTAGFAICAPLGNMCYDIFGNYNIAFMFFTILMLFVTVAMQFVLRAAGRDKEAILSAEKEAA